MKDIANIGKFQNPETTVTGEPRAKVALKNPQTLWFNTGTLCNIACTNCYIESSPTNDALVYITADEVSEYLSQLESRHWKVREIAFTGGEPFMNPHAIEMSRRALVAGYEVLILTNAMAPMMRPNVQKGLLALQADYGDRLTLRVSLDHHQASQHDSERGTGAYEKTLAGMRWLSEHGLKMAVAGRMIMSESETEARAGFAALFDRMGFNIDAYDPARTVLFPEMDETVEVPEITTTCWGVLNKSPDSVMCSNSRMVVKHKGAQTPNVVACTLLPYDPKFDLGTTLAEAETSVSLNHPHCAKFCVLGGASCSA